jgi:hypothetical protein
MLSHIIGRHSSGGTTGGLLNNFIIGLQLGAPLLPSDPIGAGATSAGFTNFLAQNGTTQEQPITLELPGIGQTQAGLGNFTVSP